MRRTTEGNVKRNLQIDDYPLCRETMSYGTHCNAMPWFYVLRDDTLVPTCRKHVSKMLEYATSHTYGDAVVVVVGQVAAYVRRANGERSGTQAEA